METKKQIILSIFHQLQEIYGRTYIQKLVFLLNKEVFKQELFSYLNYKFGPYSIEVNSELTNLVKEGLVDELEEMSKHSNNLVYKYKLTEMGLNEAKKSYNNLDRKTKDLINDYIKKFADFTPTEILRYVYKKYPEVTVNSQFEM